MQLLGGVSTPHHADTCLAICGGCWQGHPNYGYVQSRDDGRSSGQHSRSVQVLASAPQDDAKGEDVSSLGIEIGAHNLWREPARIVGSETGHRCS